MNKINSGNDEKISLSDLTAQAEKLEENTEPAPSAAGNKKSGGIDLATLMAQAEALDD